VQAFYQAGGTEGAWGLLLSGRVSSGTTWGTDNGQRVRHFYLHNLALLDGFG
jgi:hypothetical protein